MKKDRLLAVLYELLKNSKKSDRDLAKVLKISQPTITRMRKKLENSGFIKEYTAVPNLMKVGFELAAFTFMNIIKYDEKMREPSKALAERAHRWISDNPKIIFSAGGDGMRGKNCMMVTIHRNFTDFSQFISDFRSRWAKNINDIDTFIVPLDTEVTKNFTFSNLEKAKKD